MKILILTAYHMYSNKIVKDLINEYGHEIVLIAQSGVLLQDKTLFNSLKRYIDKSGIIYVVTQAIKLQIFKIISAIYSHVSDKVSNKFYSYKMLAKKENIEVQTVIDVNSADFINILKRKKVDIIVSVFFNQILKSPTIDACKSIINIHPAYLPNYKGVSPVFWALVNREKYAGVTVHFINIGIDTGDIIEKEKVMIIKGDNEHSLYWRICKVGSRLLINTITKIATGKVKTIPNKGGKYFSLPTREAVDRYRKDNKFFDLLDYIFVQ